MNLFASIATLGPIGYFKASGTLASLMCLPMLWYLRIHTIQVQTIVLILILVIAFLIIGAALPFFTRFHDPSEIVIDEVAGMAVTFYGLQNFSITVLFLGFFLFRFFDIAKPFGIKKCEYIKGACGVLLDDIVAGIFSALILRLVGCLCTI